MKSAGPPAAPRVRIGPELEERVDQLEIAAGRGNYRRRVEGEDRSIDQLSRGRLTPQKTPQPRHVRFFDCAAELVDDRLARRLAYGIDVRLERAPALEPVLTRENELGVG